MKGLKDSFAAVTIAAVLSTVPVQATEYGFSRGPVHNVPEPQYPTALFLGMGLAGLWGFKRFLVWQEKRAQAKSKVPDTTPILATSLDLKAHATVMQSTNSHATPAVSQEPVRVLEL